MWNPYKSPYYAHYHHRCIKTATKKSGRGVSPCKGVLEGMKPCECLTKIHIAEAIEHQLNQ